MALVKSTVVRTSQPADLCDLSDWAVDQGFKIALTPQTMWSGGQTVKRSGGVGAPGSAVLKAGRARTYSSTADYYADRGTLDPRDGYVFAFYGYFSAVGTWSGLFSRTSNTSTAQGVGWQRVGSTDALVVYHDGGSGASLGTLNSYLDSVPRMWVMGWDAVTKYASLYRDGVLLASAYYNVTPTYAGPGLLKIAASRDTALTSGGCLLSAFATGITPTQKLATDLYQNPWQLFEQEELTIWTADATGTPGLTASPITTGAATVGTPTIGQSQQLTASPITTGAATVGTPTIGQSQQLTASPITTGAATVGTPTLGQSQQLTAGSISTQSAQVGAPQLSQVQQLTVSPIATGAATVGTPTLGVPGVLSALPIVTAPTVVSVPALGQVQQLTASPIVTSPATVGAPQLSQLQQFLAQSVATQPIIVGAPSVSSGYSTPGELILIQAKLATMSLFAQPSASISVAADLVAVIRTEIINRG